MTKSNILGDWYRLYSQGLTARGIAVSMQQGSCAVDIDGEAVVGTVTFWAPNQVEVHFVNVQSGHTLLLETRVVSSPEELAIILERLMPSCFSHGGE